ncbi:hypothetical protein BJX99DRAFT_250200 [Aspergillus californicus]
MMITSLAFLVRAVIFVSAIITIGLHATFLRATPTNGTEMSAYIVAISVLSSIAGMIPPYPNFLYDLFWALATCIAAVFALVIQVVDSECYGFRPDNDVHCATYKAGTAFAFLMALGWLGCAALVGIYAGVRKHFRRASRIIYAAPAFAAYLLDNIPIPDVKVSLLNPTNDSIQFSMFSDIRVPDALTVNLDSMHAEFFRPESETTDNPIPFSTIDIWSLTFHPGQKVTLVNQTLMLGDLDQFAALVEDVAYNPGFGVAAQATMKVRVASLLSTTVDFTKVVTFSGFDDFPDIHINKVGVMSPDEQGNTIYGEVVVFNPASVTVTFLQGEVTFGIIAANLIVGQAAVAIDNIVPGNNTFTVRGALNTAIVEGNIEEIINEQIAHLRNGNIMVTATGVSVFYGGQRLEYWEKALQAIKIRVTRPVKEFVSMMPNSGGSSSLAWWKSEELADTVVEDLVDEILEQVKELDEDKLEEYTERLGMLGRVVLRLLRLLEIL